MNFRSIDLSQICNLSELAPVFSTSEEELKMFIDSKESLLRHAAMLKRDGSFRKIIQVRDDSYRHFLKKLSDFLYSSYFLHTPSSVHGFVKKRSILSNAQRHTQKKIVLNVDIQNFFGSISSIKVEQVFHELGFQENIAKILTELVTVDGVLATGFSTSPTISNISCLVMDRVFEKIFTEQKITYTRYVDDLTFSSDGHLPSKKMIEKILAIYGFRLNEKKLIVYRRGGPQYVTGLTVVDNRPRLSKRFKRSIRLELYYIQKYGFTEHFIRATDRAIKHGGFPSKFTSIVFSGWRLKGFISYINAIEPQLAGKIYRVFPGSTEKDFD